MVVFVVPSLYIRSVAQRVKPYLDENVILVNASKGLEEKTFLTMSQVIQSEYPDNAVGVITGPSTPKKWAEVCPPPWWLRQK